MSKNIVIQEGGNGKQFTASKLNTALVGGGSCNWVPEDEVGLTTLNVSANGTYTASSEGHYGYSQVTVNVAGGAGGAPGGAGSSIIGTDTDGDTVVSTVEDDGSITTEKQVDRIRIGVMPTKTVYVDGEAIDVTGMTVMGLTTTGTYLKFIPLSEITISPTEADISQVTSVEYQNDDGTINTVMLQQTQSGGTYYIPAVLGVNGANIPFTIGGTDQNNAVTALATRYGNAVYFAPIAPENESMADNQYGYDGGQLGALIGGSSNRFAYNGFNVSSWLHGSQITYNFPVSTVDPTRVSVSEMHLHPVGGTQTITVSWTRPSDGSVLTTSFEITVTEQTENS